MRPKEGWRHLTYTWLVIGLAAWRLAALFPQLDLDRTRELLAAAALGAAAECLAVPAPGGHLSGVFALFLALFLSGGQAAAAWAGGAALLVGQGIANRGAPARTALFNASQHVLAVWAAGMAFEAARARLGEPAGVFFFVPVLALAAAYMAANHFLVCFYTLLARRKAPGPPWQDVLKWDAAGYLVTVPLGLLMSYVYGSAGSLACAFFYAVILAAQLAARFYTAQRAAKRDLAVLCEAARYGEDLLSPREAADMILRAASRAVSYHSGAVYWRAGPNLSFCPLARRGPLAEVIGSLEFGEGEGVVGRAAAERTPLLAAAAKELGELGEGEEALSAFKSLAVIPLAAGGQTVGVMVLGGRRAGVFERAQLPLLCALGAQLAAALAGARLAEQLKEARERDPLSGLWHSNAFWRAGEEFLAAAGRQGQAVGLILLDVDRFKLFNARYGRRSGDRALAELAAVIRQCVRPGGVAARYGGDEFAVLLPGAAGRTLLETAQSLCAAARQAVFLTGEGRSARLTVSAGAAEYPRDASGLKGLLAAAQRALEKAAAGGGDRAEAAAVFLDGLD